MNTQKQIRLLKAHMNFKKGQIYTPPAAEAQLLVMMNKAEYYVEDIHQSPLNRAMSAVTAATTIVRGNKRRGGGYETKSDHSPLTDEALLDEAN